MNTQFEIQDGWTRKVVTENGNEFKYHGILELKASEIVGYFAPKINPPDHDMPFLVIVSYDDTVEFWAVKRRDCLVKLEAYLDTNREAGCPITMIITSPEDIRPVCRHQYR